MTHRHGKLGQHGDIHVQQSEAGKPSQRLRPPTEMAQTTSVQCRPDHSPVATTCPPGSYVARACPKRTNEFQELITLLIQTLGEDRATPSAMVRSKVPGVRKREVDIRVVAEVDGLPVYVGIEVSASKSRRKSVEWVERMYGKHDHLATSKLVLVSSSGFTKGALKLAEYHKIDAITPGEVTPGFVGEIVNNLTSLWLETLNFSAEKVIFVLDPPTSPPVEVRPDIWESVAVHDRDSTPIVSIGQLVTYWVREKIDISEVDLRGVGEEKRFNLEQPGPVVVNGGPIFLQGREEGDPAETLRRIVRFEIDGKLEVSGTEMLLQHGHFDGVNYSNSTAVLDDLAFHWAAVEGEDGLRIGTRIARVDDPTNAQTYRRIEGGTQMVRVPEGNSDT